MTTVASPYPRRFDKLAEMVGITYSIPSTLGEIEGNRYQQHIFGEAFLESETGERIKTIGKISGVKVLLGQARNDSKWSYDIFDTSQDLFEIGEIVYDFEKGDFSNALREHYDGDFFESSILILNNIEVLPEYRGIDIGAHLIRDFYNQFISQCAIFITIPEARQFNDRYKSFSDEEMMYERFELNPQAATERVRRYFQRLGFQIIPGLSDELMFINTALVNRVFDRIILE